MRGGQVQGDSKLTTPLQSVIHTSTHTHTNTQAQGDSKLAALLQSVYREVAALKSREASSENVLRVAKETLDARKKQVPCVFFF